MLRFLPGLNPTPPSTSVSSGQYKVNEAFQHFRRKRTASRRNALPSAIGGLHAFFRLAFRYIASVLHSGALGTGKLSMIGVSKDLAKPRSPFFVVMAGAVAVTV